VSKNSFNVYSNAQDAVGNTMNAGRIVVHGRAGDVVEPYKLEREVSFQPMTEEDWTCLRRYLAPYCAE
jgi:formylmethanofuran dehydrogenase subunit C